MIHHYATVHLDTQEIWSSSYKFKNYHRRRPNYHPTWANVDGISSSGYHEKTNLPSESRRSLTRGTSKIENAYRFCLVVDGNMTRVIAHVSNPRAVRLVTCSVRWYECCIQKFFNLYFVGRVHSRLDHPHILASHPNLCVLLCMYQKLPSHVYTHVCILCLHLYLSIHIYRNIFTLYMLIPFHTSSFCRYLRENKLYIYASFYSEHYYYNYTFL